MARGRYRGRGREFHLFIVDQLVVTGRKKCPSCLVFVVTFFVKGVDGLDKVVDGCGVLDSLEDI